MTPKEIIDIKLGPNQSVMAVMNETGDKKTIYDRSDAVQVEAARAEFKVYKDKGYMAYRMLDEGRKGEILHAFDPKAEKVVFAPPMQGGTLGGLWLG